MSILAKADILTLMDCLARERELVSPLLGDDEATSNTLRLSALRMWQTVVSGAETALSQTPLTNLGTVLADLRTTRAPAVFVPNLVRSLMTALRTECDNDIGAWLLANTSRCHYEFALLHQGALGAIAPISVIFPPVQKIAQVTRGASASTYAHTAALDVTKYGGAQLCAIAEGAIGVANYVLTVTCRKFDGTNYSTEDKQVTVTANSVTTTSFDIGTSTDLYVDVTGITTTGGTSGDHVNIYSKLTRSIAAALTA